MTHSKRGLVLLSMLGVCGFARSVTAQAADSGTHSAAPVVPQTAPAASAPLPAQVQPAQPTQPPAGQQIYSVHPAQPTTVQPSQPVVPPGYVLVPADSAYARAAQEKSAEAQPPADLPYTEGLPVPEGYHVIEEPRRGLVIGGSLSLGIPWVLGATVAVSNDFQDKSGYLMIPAVGPWLMLAAGGAKDKSCPDSGTDVFCDDERDRSGERALLFLDGMAQVAGVIMLAAGIGYPRKRLVREPTVLSLAPTPMGRDGYGFGAVGTF